MTLKIDSIIRTSRRTLSLEITADARLIIRAPQRARDEHILKVVREKQEWILRKQAEILERKQDKTPKRFSHGEEFLYLGECYSLHIDYASEKRLKLEERFIMPGKDLADPEAAFEAWYRKQAREYIQLRAKALAAEFGLSFRQLKITGAKKRWGSCSAGKTINFSWRLILAPPEVVFYVIAHELAHLKHMNHSREFWEFVAQMCPDYKIRRKWLKENGHTLKL